MTKVANNEKGVPVQSHQAKRRHDLDALRVLATFLLIIFHTARAFDHEPWHIKNDVLSYGMDILVVFISNWHMPLFFLLAGAGMFYSLQRRSPSQFLDERVQRLLIPFSVGMLLIVPPQVYIERIGSSAARQSPIDFAGSFLEFYPTFFTQGIYPDGNLSWHHLWFIFYLFLLSALLLPLFLYLRNSKHSMLKRWTDFLSTGHRVFLMALPLMVIRMALIGMFPGPQNLVQDVANVVTFATLLLYGYLLVADPRMQEAVIRNRFPALATALAGTALLAVILINFDWPAAYTGMYFLVQATWSLCTWAWLLTLVAFAYRFLNRDQPWVRKASEIAYPFYIVHQTVIVVVAHFILPLDFGVWAKFASVAGISLIMTWLLSSGIKLTNVTRFLFGVKLQGGGGKARDPGLKMSP